MKTEIRDGLGLGGPLCSPVFASADMCAVSGPCGHLVPLEDAWVARDRYECPVCGLRWRVDQAPPEVYPSGFVMPGKRTVVTEDQGNLPMRLPHPDDIAARKKLAARPRPPIRRVMQQAKAAREYLANITMRNGQEPSSDATTTTDAPGS